MKQKPRTHDDDLRLMLRALEQLEVEVRMEHCESAGGLVRMRKRWVLLLNPFADLESRKGVCLAALGRFDTQSIHLPPRLRALLGDEEW